MDIPGGIFRNIRKFGPGLALGNWLTLLCFLTAKLGTVVHLICIYNSPLFAVSPLLVKVFFNEFFGTSFRDYLLVIVRLSPSRIYFQLANWFVHLFITSEVGIPIFWQITWRLIISIMNHLLGFSHWQKRCLSLGVGFLCARTLRIRHFCSIVLLKDRLSLTKFWGGLFAIAHQIILDHVSSVATPDLIHVSELLFR